jgi:hypothetical protein
VSDFAVTVAAYAVMALAFAGAVLVAAWPGR